MSGEVLISHIEKEKADRKSLNSDRGRRAVTGRGGRPVDVIIAKSLCQSQALCLDKSGYFPPINSHPGFD